VTQATPPKPDFNQYRDTYRDAVQESLALSGTEVDFFIRAKAQHLVDLAQQVGDPRRLEVLDVGCGIGETDRFLEGHFGALAGVDIAPDLLERAAEANPWADYRFYPEGEPIPHADASFDLTFAICVLHHVPPAERVGFVSELKRVTRPGGMVAIFEHNPWNPLTRASVRNCEFDEGVELLSRRETRQLLAEQGLQTTEGSYIVFFPRDGGVFKAMERGLGWLPAGAQYYVAARRPEVPQPVGA
jgi:SAM-dependent methyltransferase